MSDQHLQEDFESISSLLDSFTLFAFDLGGEVLRRNRRDDTGRSLELEKLVEFDEFRVASFHLNELDRGFHLRLNGEHVMAKSITTNKKLKEIELTYLVYFQSKQVI